MFLQAGLERYRQSDDVPTGVLEDPSMTTFHDRDGRANNDDHYSKLARLMLRIGCYHG